ncbi:hypothetical protein N9I07_00555 [Candidatus Thioglobus sp.]|jgi:DNA-binding transcriptional MocR family regulator|nr:hypothetical protein [Candidatus Thioglobus sp.]MDB9933550.1 hypothetical protein [Candidatus Thioglobus sp.]MDC0483367.1 hypothetical protein [Candidatus Thioglobus sp.]
MKPTEWGYGVQTSHLFPLVNHLEKGVAVRPGNASFAEKKPPANYLHLGYSAIDTNKINKGKGIIVKEIKEMMH